MPQEPYFLHARRSDAHDHLKSAIVLLLVNFALLGTILPLTEPVYSSSYTHALLDEHFTATWCPSCLTDEPNVLKAYNDLDGSLFVISYHVSDELSNPAGDSMIVDYQAHTIPYHVLDGGYKTGKGGIYTVDMQDTAERSVHRIGLAIRKAIRGNTLEYEGSIQELDGKAFTGFVQVYITENKLKSEGIEWNFVFRAFGIKKQVSIQPRGSALFSGTWTIPSNVKVENVLAVAAVFDSSTAGYYGPYGVQAVDDSKSGQVIPEMFTPIQMTIAVLFITFAVVYRMKRSVRDKFQNG